MSCRYSSARMMRLAIQTTEPPHSRRHSPANDDQLPAFPRRSSSSSSSPQAPSRQPRQLLPAGRLGLPSASTPVEFYHNPPRAQRSELSVLPAGVRNVPLPP